MPINPSIFKAYDIRGIYPDDINEEAAYNIGRAIVCYTKADNIVIGKDCRLSSDKLEEKIIQGIINQGANVVKIGMATTPMVYYASGKLAVDAGVIITASHNPAEYNGMKLCLKQAVPIGEGAGMEEIKALAINGVFPEANKKGAISENFDFKRQYLDHIKRFFNANTDKKLKIVFDFANAMAIIDKTVFDELKIFIESVYMYDEFDGRFPNHEANPLKAQTLEELQKKVLETGADLGVAFDGDADRVGFVNEKGEIVPMDFITGMIAKEILKKHPGGLVLMDLRSSNAVKEYIESAGGRVDLCRVGHSLIKKQMREEGAVFAGELSGHYYFDENYKAELSGLAAIMIMNLINESGKKLSELTKDLKKYFHSGEINSEVENKAAVFTKLKEKYKNGRLNELDGIRIDFDDWWFNVRASNTEPKVRLNLEANSKELMEEKRDEILNVIRN
ncbi:phosphomannomutase/phosphoglucomutase [Candidatus Parcubacteria bacterium]|nr:phosphomannomutase/phosphoglucomutase [Candidatus Parcubacteria bacterium]